MSSTSELRSPLGGDGRPLFLEFRSSYTFIIMVVGLSLFTDVFLYGMITPVMPDALVTRAGVPSQDREYWTSVMLIAEAVTCFVCAPICGYMIDNKSSAKHLYLFGLIMLIASMLLFASANSLQVYIIARMPQGAAMAMVFVAGLTLIVECTPKDKIGYMFGYIDIFMVGGLISGPLLGGAIYHLAGYYAVFGMALILLSIDLILRLAIIDKATAQKWLSTQESGHESGVENTSATGYGSIERSAQHNDNIVHDTSIFWRLIREPRIVISALGILAYALLISAFETTLPVFVVDHFHWDSLGAGCIFIPVAMTAFLGPLFGRFSDRFGPRMNTFVGFSLATPCLICLRVVQSNTTEHKVILCVLLFSIGICINAVNPAVMAEMQSAIFELEENEPGIFGDNGAIGRTCGLQQMTQCVGFALGPVLGGFVDHRYGWGATTVVLGVVASAAAVPGLWLSGPKSEKSLNDGIMEREPLLSV